MALEGDLLIDRRRLKRRLVGWRITAVVAVIVAVVLGAALAGGLPRLRLAGLGGGGRFVATLAIDGLITDRPTLTRRVAALADDRRVAALVLLVDSPGGSVAGGEGMHDAVAAVAARKPVVAVMGGTAASAAYMISCAATRIFAREGTLTGSIGVILETPQASGLLDKLGVGVTTIVSGPYKDQPSLTHPTSPQGTAMLQGLVMDLYDQFVGMVSTGRHLDADRVRALADGRPYTGRQAKALGLIDAYGGETEARAWLAADKGVPRSLPERRITDRRSGLSTLWSAWQGTLKALSLQGVSLDGPMSVWQPLARDG